MTPPDRLDTLGMYGATAGLPEQLAAAAASASQGERLPAHDDIENVVVLGMGGSGIAGDLLTVIAGPFMAVPIVVHKGYGIPNFIGENTLVFAISFSGNTEETLEGAAEAMLTGGRMVCISNGGELREQANDWGVPHIKIADGIPMPRAGLGAVAAPPMIVLEKMGFFPGASSWISAAVDQLKIRRDELIADGNEANSSPSASAARCRWCMAARASATSRRCGGRTSSTRTARSPRSRRRSPKCATTRSAGSASTAT